MGAIGRRERSAPVSQGFVTKPSAKGHLDVTLSSEARGHRNMPHGLEHIGPFAIGACRCFHRSQRPRVALRLGRGVGGGEVRAAAGRIASRHVGGRLDPEAPLPRRGATFRASRDLFPSGLSGEIQFAFGVQDPGDSAIPVIKSLIARYPGLDVQLVVTAASHGANRKVRTSSICGVARHPVLVVSDSDEAVGPDYLRTLAAELAGPRVGAVTCLYRGLPSAGFWSRLSAMAADNQFLPSTLLGSRLG